MTQKLFDYPLPNNGDRYDLSQEELVELLRKAYNNGRLNNIQYYTTSNDIRCPNCGADLWCLWSETTAMYGPGNMTRYHCNNCGYSWEV